MVSIVSIVQAFKANNPYLKLIYAIVNIVAVFFRPLRLHLFAERLHKEFPYFSKQIAVIQSFNVSTIKNWMFYAVYVYQVFLLQIQRLSILYLLTLCCVYRMLLLEHLETVHPVSTDSVLYLQGVTVGAFRDRPSCIWLCVVFAGCYCWHLETVHPVSTDSVLCLQDVSVGTYRGCPSCIYWLCVVFAGCFCWHIQRLSILYLLTLSVLR